MMQFNTKRLKVGPISDSDREAAIDLLIDHQVKLTYMVPDFASREEAARLFTRLKDLSQQDGRYVAGIHLDGAFIGIMNETEIHDTSIELGYAILPKFHNCGYCTEALSGAIQYLFAHGFDRVIAGAFETNQASLRVMVKCGMEKLDEQDEIEYRGTVHHCVYYGIQKINPVE